MMAKQRFIFAEQPVPTAKPHWALIVGDALRCLGLIPDGAVRCWLSSPPYYKKIDYGHELQCGLEETVREYIAYQSEVAREMLRASTRDANLFWVIQDTHNFSGGTGGDYLENDRYRVKTVRGPRVKGWPRKGQLLIPERTRIAFAEVGWVPFLKIIWDKDDPFHGAEDRPSYSYEEILLFGASPDHFWNHDAVRLPYAKASITQTRKPYLGRGDVKHFQASGQENPSDKKRRTIRSMQSKSGARVRSVWHIPSGSQPTIHINGQHRRGIACFPKLLADVCISLGSAPGDTIGDPYAGWGTTLLSALTLGRSAVGIEVSPERVEIIEKRLADAGFTRQGKE